MKKINLFVLLFALASLGFGSAVLADQDNQGREEENSIKVEQDRVSGRETADSKATSTDNDRDNNDNDRFSTTTNRDQDDNASSTPGSNESEVHRSSVANLVQNLLKVAEHDPGIGEEVRVIARQQNESGSTTVKAMKEVEDRNSVKTLLFGTDYKNLGVLRSEIATSSQQIERLKALILQTTNSVDKASLEAQIAVLEANQVKIDLFIKDHENTFSFLGWFVRLFNR